MEMPRLFRSMIAEDGKPKVGAEAKMLGVRVAPHPHPDIPVDPTGIVNPNSGGMSVAPEWRKLPWHLIPKRLHPRGRAHSDVKCWRLGDGEFKDGAVNPDLFFRLDPAAPEKHGVVEPARTMTIAEYQAALAATRNDWALDEN
jgi:hypothetical protein